MADRSAAGKLLASFKRPREGKCLECSARIEGPVNRRYCSAACKVRAYRRRRKERPVDA